METTSCPFCGRTDVPVCERCKKRVPHGNTFGTWLPCPCDRESTKESAS